MTGPYRIRAAGALIGTAALDGFDPTTAVAFGRMVPGPGYAAVRAVFVASARLPASGLTDDPRWRAYVLARDALALALEAADGRGVAARWIHIEDFQDERGPGAIEIAVHVLEPGFFTALDR